jgi:serine/threonine protein kinase
MMEDDPKTGIKVEPVGKMACSKCGTEFDVSPFESFSAVQCPQCSARQTVAAKLGHFILLRLIGTGGMGGVYHARDETLGRDVAIKVMLKSLGDDAQFVETFRREAQAAAKLNHPNIAQIYSFGQAQGQPYIVMELVRNNSLANMMEDSQRLDPSLAMDIGLHIAEGLQAAYEIGLMHGDIKPENILMDERGNAKLVDFGLASFVDQAAAEGVWGTPYYIAPEKIKRQKADARSDIYSLGGTLYHAIAGQAPFDGKTPLEVIQARLGSTPPDLATVAKGTDKAVSGIVMRMLEEQPARRYPTYASLISDMRKAVSTLPKPTKAPVTKRLRPASKGRRIVTKKRPTDPTGGPVVGNGRQTSTKLRVNKTTTSESALSDYRPPLTASPKPTANRKKQVGVIVGVIAGVIVLLGMVAGGIWFKQWRDAKLAERTRQVLLRKASDEARECIAETYAATTNITRAAAAGRTVATQTTNAIARTLEEALPRKSPTEAQKADYAALRELNKTIVAAVQDLDRKVGAVDKIREAADKALSKTLESAEVDLARKRMESVRKVHEVTAKAESDAKTTRTTIEDAATEVEALRKKIDADWKRIQDDRTAAAAAIEAEEKAKEEAARKATRLKKELEMVKTARETQAVSRDSYRYSQAANDLQAQLSEYETQEGKRTMQVEIDRYRRLADLKKAIIKKLAAPYKWGWVSGRSPTDVLGADDNGVRLKGQVVPWDKVSTRQMLHFVKYLVGDRKLPVSQRGDLNLSAAVFCRVHGGEELSKKFVDSATSFSPRLQDEADRLLPPLPETEE